MNEPSAGVLPPVRVLPSDHVLPPDRVLSSDRVPAPVRILIVEDTPTQAELARAMLGGLGHEIRLAETAGAAFGIAQSWAPNAILLDLELPDYSGIDLMRQLRSAGIDAAVIVITANGSINVAVEAMREGAVDFIVKPFSKARLAVTLSNSLEKRALAAQLRNARARLERDRFFGFIGASAAMQAVYRTIEAVASSKASVFLTGESGTGKELAADAVHRASPRRSRRFVALNCGAIPRDLLESEVFGHVKGAFTGAVSDRPGAAMLADGGTLFLDEIGEMPLDMQVKLLRFVQTGTFQPVGSSHVERVDVRFVCATNRDPLVEVQAGRFREDLFYRLYVVPIELPPLRARGDDVKLIARHFLERYSREEGRHFALGVADSPSRAISDGEFAREPGHEFSGFSPQAEQLLMAYAWPGNVRQLQNVVRNIVVLHDGEQVETSMLPSPLLAGHGAAGAITPNPEHATLARREPLGREPYGRVDVSPQAEPAGKEPAGMEILPLAVMEKRMILAALRHTGQDVPQAAALLQVNPSTIYRKLHSWRNDPGTSR
jgi:two-component system repressor protein LuxO